MKCLIVLPLLLVLVLAERREYPCRDKDVRWCSFVKRNIRNCNRPSTFEKCAETCGAVRCGGDAEVDCFDRLPEWRCSRPDMCQDKPRRCMKTCGLCRKQGDTSCRDMNPKWCKQIDAATSKYACNSRSNYNDCKKSCGAVQCGGADGCYDELPQNKCNCGRYPERCAKTCGQCY